MADYMSRLHRPRGETSDASRMSLSFADPRQYYFITFWTRACAGGPVNMRAAEHPDARACGHAGSRARGREVRAGGPA